MSWFDASNIANLAKNALKEAQKTFDKALDITEEEKENEEVIHDVSSQYKFNGSESPSNNIIQTEPKASNNTLWESFGMPFFDKGISSVDNAVTEIDCPSSVHNKCRLDELMRIDKNELNVPPEDRDHSENNETSSTVIRRQRKQSTNNNRFSIISNESDRKSTPSSDSVEILDSTSATASESEISPINQNYLSYVPSVEVLTSSSVEILSIVEDLSGIEATASESVYIVPDIGDAENNRSMGGGTDDTSTSENTVTAFDLGNRSSVKDILRSSSIDTSITEVLSPWESSVGKTMNEQPDSIPPETHLEFSGDAILESKLLIKRSRNELSGTSVNTLDSSSCDEGTMIGSSSDETPKECTSSVSSLKSMLADAINEQPDEWTNREYSPTTSSMESRQENLKIGSSGHTSADELETATSSDIEIISNPNGDSSNANSRQSPAKLIYKNSKGKMAVVLSSDVLIPEIIGRSLTFKMKGHNREPSETSSGGSDDNLEIDRLLKKVAELHEVLEARETKLIDLSVKNAELSESNCSLKSQLECQMNEEFTQRLAAMEKKFQQAIREKEMLHKQLQTFKHSDSLEFDEDKDQIIKELREEGEKLSKQQLAANVLIKKLRNTEKENVKLISSLREQNDGLMQELERAKKSLSAKDELERSQIEAINQFSKNNQKLEKQVQGLQNQVDNLTSTLVSCHREVDERNEKIRTLEHERQEVTSFTIQEVLQKAEIDLNEERERREKLEFSLSSLQIALQNIEMQYSERETFLRKENQKLSNVLEEYKSKNEKLTEEMLNCTKPIVKQLEDEIYKSNMTTSFWEKQEKELVSTTNELQDRVKTLSENEQRLEKCLQSYENEVKDLKAKNKFLRSEVDNAESKLKFQLKVNDLLREQNEGILNEKNDEIESLKTQLEVAMKQKSEEPLIERPRNINEIYRDKSKLKLLLQGDAGPTHESDSDISMLSPSPSPQTSEESSHTWLGPLEDDPGPSCSQKSSIYDGPSRPIATTTNAIENLQTQYKLKEGEVQQLQWELKKHVHERIILTNEITLLAAKVEELEKKISTQNDVQTKYDALLQMYGQKIEECQELRLDLEDVKEMYKIQIDELLTRSRTG